MSYFLFLVHFLFKKKRGGSAQGKVEGRKGKKREVTQENYECGQLVLLSSKTLYDLDPFPAQVVK